MSSNVTLSGTIVGVGSKGPLGPVALALALQNQRATLEMGVDVAAGDAARPVALPVEGAVQSAFVLCTDNPFTFTINGAGITYELRNGGIFVLGRLPLVNSIEVTGNGSTKATVYLLRVMES